MLTVTESCGLRYNIVLGEVLRMTTSKANEIWENVLGRIREEKDLSEQNYRTWMAETIGLRWEGNLFTVGAPNSFVAEYLEKNLMSTVEKRLHDELGCSDAIVTFEVKGKVIAQAYNSEKGLVDPDTGLQTDLTFDTIVSVAYNEKALFFARKAVMGLGDKRWNPLFFHGPPGCGKTVILNAIGNYGRANGLRVVFTNTGDYINGFVNSVFQSTPAVANEFRRKHHAADLLLFDDIQFIIPAKKTSEAFFEAFNEVLSHGGQVVLTSDVPPKFMANLMGRLLTRFEFGQVVGLDYPDFDSRLGILNAWAQEDKLNLSPEVLALIAKRNVNNIRSLRGLLNQVLNEKDFQEAKTRKRMALTCDMTRKILGQAVETFITSREILVDVHGVSLVTEAVVEAFKLTREIILDLNQTDELVKTARGMSIYLAAQKTNCTPSQIGKAFGGFTGKQIRSICEKMDQIIKAEPSLIEKIVEVEKNLEQSLRQSQEGCLQEAAEVLAEATSFQ
jgi:chromosomal replication initiator protein